MGQEHLALFGAVGIAWNDLEGALDTALGAATGLPEPMWSEVTSRINGFDGKCALLKRCCKIIRGMTDEHLRLVEDTLGAAQTHKRFRDGVVHAKILDPSAPTAPTFERRGNVGEVLVTEEALKNLYERIEWVRAEIECVLKLFTALDDYEAADTEDEKQSAELRAKSWIPRLQKYQHQRKSLPPLPKFPQEPEAQPKTEDPEAPPG